ncbi:MAG: hypothetical protein WA705_08705 [Candidatus Ozemobacteraceae bacterium]
MSDKNVLFPFPPSSGEGADNRHNSSGDKLPRFPEPISVPVTAPIPAPSSGPVAETAGRSDPERKTAESFSPEEVRDLKEIARLYRSGGIVPGHGGDKKSAAEVSREFSGDASALFSNPPAGAPAIPNAASGGKNTPQRGNDPFPARLASDFGIPSPGAGKSSGEAGALSVEAVRQALLVFFEGHSGTGAFASTLSSPSDEEAKNAWKAALEDIQDLPMMLTVWGHLAGIFPVREFLRHGTPEQRLFTLMALGDRFLTGITGLAFSGRPALIQAVASYLSDVSECATFFAMEGDPFNNQHHERVPGSSPSGRMVREMRGFLVVRRGNNQIIRLGRVWT